MKIGIILITMIMLIMGSFCVSAALTDNLVAYWTFDSGETLTDVQSNTHNLTNVNGAESGSCHLGECFTFNRVDDDKLTALDHADLDILNDMSICAWINGASSNVHQSIVDKRQGNPNFSYNIIFWNDGTVYANQQSGGVSPNNLFDGDNAAYNIGQWDYYCWVRHNYGNETNEWKYYVNGTLISEDTANQIPGANSELFRIGSDPSTGAFNGMIDELGIWDTPLTTGEMLSLYNGGSGLEFPFASLEIDFFNNAPLNATDIVNDTLPYTETFYINFTSTDDELVDCYLYEDDVLINTSTGINTTLGNTSISRTWTTQINYTPIYYAVSCNDTSTLTANETKYYNILVDEVNPIININQPVNLSIHYANTTDVNVSFTDDNLFNASVDIINSTGHNVYSNYTDFINTTYWDFNDTFTYASYDDYTLSARACDGHTKKNINFDKWNIAQHDTGVGFGNCNIYSSLNVNQIDYINYTCDNDRCTWEFEFINTVHDPIFYVECDDPIYQIFNTDYQGHLISGDNWIDAENDLDLDVDVNKINDYTYSYTFLGTIKNIKTESIGELNCYELNSTFSFAAPVDYNTTFYLNISDDSFVINTTNVSMTWNVSDSNPDYFNISIFDMNDSLVYWNESLNMTDTLVFTLFPFVGVYNVYMWENDTDGTISTFNDTITVLGVSITESLSTGSCPDEIPDAMILIGMICFACFLMVIGLSFKIPVLGFLGGLVLLFAALPLYGCFTMFGVLMVGIGMFVSAWFGIFMPMNR